MDGRLVINAIIRQTVVLIAHLAVGTRKPVGHIADQVLQQLADALEEQGLSKAVIADMFGMTLRNYRRRFGAADRGDMGPDQYLLRHEIFAFVEGRGQASREAITDRFARGEPRKATSCLRDLVKMKMLFKTGSGRETLYMPTPESVRQGDEDPLARVALLVWVAVFRLTPRAGATTFEVIQEEMGIDEEVLGQALARLVAERRVMVETVGKEEVFSCDQCVMDSEDGHPEGWEAAVLDHYQAMVTALVKKLRQRMDDADIDPDPVGGSTYTFGIWDGHPMEEEVLGFLDGIREQATSLRARVVETNAALKVGGQMPDEGQKRVIFYGGQMVKRLEQ